MIEKKIHYCWFGRGEKPQLVKRCIASWKKHCPDYEIIEWNESNYDVHGNEYLDYCYKNKKYAFLSDYARLDIIYKNGGIYLDTDVELCKSLDSLLDNKFYIGFENNRFLNTGLGFAAEANNSIVKVLKDEYSYYDGGELIGCPILNTQALEKYGVLIDGTTQITDEYSVYAPEFFNPYDDASGKLNIVDCTYSIHWFSKSWYSKRLKYRFYIGRLGRKIFGPVIARKIRRIIYGKD